MHFLKNVVETPILDDPARNHKNIHRHFYRYSRGDFIGPALKISQTKAKITLKGSHEYEDLILEIVASGISNPDDNFEIKGRLISGSDVSDIISDLGLLMFPSGYFIKYFTGHTGHYIYTNCQF